MLMSLILLMWYVFDVGLLLFHTISYEILDDLAYPVINQCDSNFKIEQ